MELGDGLVAMGIGRHTSRVPVLLAMALRALRGDHNVERGRSSKIACLGLN